MTNEDWVLIEDMPDSLVRRGFMLFAKPKTGRAANNYPIPAHWNGQNWITLHGNILNEKEFTHVCPITLPEPLEEK